MTKNDNPITTAIVSSKMTVYVICDQMKKKSKSAFKITYHSCKKKGYLAKDYF